MRESVVTRPNFLRNWPGMGGDRDEAKPPSATSTAWHNK